MARIYFRPSSSSPFGLIPFNIGQSKLNTSWRQKLQSFSTTSRQQFFISLPNLFKPSKFQLNQSLEKHPRDEEIDYNLIKFVNAEGKMEGVKYLREILGSMDRKKYWLVQVSTDIKPPICKLVDKKLEYLKHKSIRQRAKESSKLQHGAITKQVQISWNVSENDSMRKFSHAKEFLQKGYHVQLIVKPKKGQKPNREEAEAMRKKVIDTLSGHAKDIQESPALKKWTLIFELKGKAIQKGQKNQDSEKKEKEQEKEQEK
ncbi:hypothetical protein G9A89_021527 [Geosiphon pyriformis]|nr:hypothetical protein G9A89_021527 [Geosiphon pyriformis]